MILKAIFGALLVAVPLYPTLASTETPDSFCELSKAPLKYEGAPGKIEMESLRLARRAEGLITFTNTTSVAISRIVVVADYFDSQDRRKFSLIYSRSTGSVKAGAFLGRWLPVVVPQAKESIAPGGVVKVPGSSPLTSRTCPSKGAVTFVQLDFEDGNSSSWSTPGWHVDIDLGSAPNPEVPRSLVAGRKELMADLQITLEGKLAEFEPHDDRDPPLVSALQAALARWVFLPPASSGRPLQTRITMVFRFEATPEPKFSRIDTLESVPEGPFVLVDFLLKDNSQSDWYVYFGGIAPPAP
jgi:hypothetical protein